MFTPEGARRVSKQVGLVIF